MSYTISSTARCAGWLDATGLDGPWRNWLDASRRCSGRDSRFNGPDPLATLIIGRASVGRLQCRQGLVERDRPGRCGRLRRAHGPR